MPFDPNLPANNSPIVSAELRNQLNGLKALIDQKTSPDDISSLAAANIDGFTQLGTTLSDPPTRDEVQTIIVCLNQLIVSLQAHPDNS